MDDLISRQAAIDRINKQREHLKPDIDERDAIGDAAYRVCAEFIERLPSAPPKKVCVSEIQVKIDDIKDYIDKVIEEVKTNEWLHDLLQDAIDAGIITETQASRLMDRIAEDNT